MLDSLHSRLALLAVLHETTSQGLGPANPIGLLLTQ